MEDLDHFDYVFLDVFMLPRIPVARIYKLQFEG